VRSRREAALGAIVVVALLLGAPAIAAAPPQESRDADAAIDGAEVARALTIVQADPNLASERTIKTLRWKTSPGKRQRGAKLSWLVDLVRWIDQSARALVWVSAVVLAAVVVIAIARTVGTYRPSRREAIFVAPTHVRDLDIRPETLPADVGAAARALWQRDERRAALALLYRGLLSRLAHVHQVPIRDSTTEADCLALTVPLSDSIRDYAAQLVTVWQRHTYGHLDVGGSIVGMLCDRFEPVLDAGVARDPRASGEPA
jgi:hypothetical protein